MKKYLTITLLLLLTISCKNSFITEGLNNDGNFNHFKNSINNFSKTSLFNKDRAFFVFFDEELINVNIQAIVISKFNYFLLRPSFKIGDTINYIPNSFLEMNGKLFVWNEPNKPFNNEILEVLAKYNKIDSSMYKLEMGIGSLHDVPHVSSHDYSKKYYYFYCKNDITKFKAIKGRRLPKEIPVLICD